MRKGCPWALAHIGHSLFAFIGRQTVCGRCEALYACRLVTSRGTRSVPQWAKPFVKTKKAILCALAQKDSLYRFHKPEKEGFEAPVPFGNPHGKEVCGLCHFFRTTSAPDICSVSSLSCKHRYSSIFKRFRE